ncbi:MAG: T9SS type A sorting domain-containing protein [Ignavibacteriales bacterium]|nr:T9SS type A sorting domain-containing protein [Ignavibacteriales bacterium]
MGRIKIVIAVFFLFLVLIFVISSYFSRFSRELQLSGSTVGFVTDNIPKLYAGNCVDKNILIRWENIEDKEIKCFFVYRSLEKDSTQAVKIAEVEYPATEYIDKCTSYNYQYYYWISLGDYYFGESKLSNNVSVKSNYLSEPKNVEIEIEFEQVNLKWASTSNHSNLYYKIYKNEKNDSIKSTLAGTVDYPSSEFIDPNKVYDTTYYWIATCDEFGNESQRIKLSSVSKNNLLKNIQQNETVVEFELQQNYPNPFNSSTKIPFNIKSDGYVKLSIYDVTGSCIENLVEDNYYQGNYEITYNANNIASGVYFIVLQYKDLVDKKKMVLVK